jgi:hypothetical protein
MARLGGYGVPVEPNTHQPIRNEHWPRNTDDFAVREPIDVWVRIWWAHLWPTEVLPAVADRWGRWHVRVVLTPAVRGRDVVWLRPSDVRRRHREASPPPAT